MNGMVPKQASLEDVLALLLSRRWTGTMHLDLKDGEVKEARLQTEQRVKLQTLENRHPTSPPE